MIVVFSVSRLDFCPITKGTNSDYSFLLAERHQRPGILIVRPSLNGDSDEPDHLIPAQADHQFRGKLTRGFRDKLTTLNV